MSMPDDEPLPKPFVLEYGAPPPPNKAGMLWHFGGTAWWVANALFLGMGLLESAGSREKIFGPWCCFAGFACTVIALIGMVVASSVHAIRFYALGPQASSRRPRIHMFAGAFYVPAFIAGMLAVINLADFGRATAMAAGLISGTVFGAAAGFFLVTKERT